MARPRIGVTSWHHPDREERWEYVRDNYTRSVYRAGGLPIIFPMPSADPAVLDEYLASVNGLLFTGGEDVHPEFYGEGVRPACEDIDRERDLFELGLAKRALERGVPTFGICRGHQLLNVACGGTLFQDLSERPGTVPEHRTKREERAQRRHGVRVLPGTQLHQIVGGEALKVTSTHHQFINRLGGSLKATAFSDDGIIEAIELPAHPFFLAVQWHPERMADKDAVQLALFQALVRAAGRRP
jgi:putative glutamine amidotransferase